MNKLLYYIFGHISLVNHTAFTFTSEAKRKMRSGWAVGSKLFIKQSRSTQDTFEAHNEKGQQVYSINLKGQYYAAL